MRTLPLIFRGVLIFVGLLVLATAPARAEDTSWRADDTVDVVFACPTSTAMLAALDAYGDGDIELSNEILTMRCSAPISTVTGKAVSVPGVLMHKISGSHCWLPTSCVTGWAVRMPRGETVYLALPDDAGPHGGIES